MQLWFCEQDNKIITETALNKGICAGHNLIPYNEPQEEKIIKVAISIPNEGHTLPESYDNHLIHAFRLGGLQERWRYEKRNPRYEFYFYSTARLLTQMARERLVRVALDASMDYIIMYDDDMVLPPSFFENMLEDIEQHPEIDILGALAFMRNPPHYPVMYSTKEGYDSIRKANYYINQFVQKYPRNKLVECDAVGFGAVCIKMAMIKKMKEPYFMSTTATGEDIMFCVNAKKQAKARVFMDTRIKLGHLATPQIIDEDYFDKWCKENKHEIADIPHKYALDKDDIKHKYLELDR
jgi:GT2 family glycosyltransferase